MKNLLIAASFALFIVPACAVSPGPHHGEVTVAPLPAIVVLGADPYFYQNGYYYYYNNNNWRYSNSRSGPWSDLPRSHWPKEIRHRDKNYKHNVDRYDDDGRDHRQEYNR